MGEKGNIAESLPAAAASGATAGGLPAGPKGTMPSPKPDAALKDAFERAPQTPPHVPAVEGADAHGMPSARVGGTDAAGSSGDLGPAAALGGGAAAGSAGLLAARRRRGDDQEAAESPDTAADTAADPDAMPPHQPDDDAAGRP